MDRRTLLRLMGSLPLGTTLGFRPRGERVVVVGGGILGTAIAYRLARRGAEVTLCEAKELGNGASSRSGAWVNAHHAKQPHNYFQLSHLSALAWHELQAEVPGVTVKWGGRIEWQREGADARDMRAAVERQQRWGYPVEFLELSELQELIPSLVVDASAEVVIRTTAEGAVEPMVTMRALAAAAREAGAQVRTGTTVTSLIRERDRVVGVVTASGPIEADVVVVAAGVDTETLASWADVRVPLRPAPGVLAHLAPEGPSFDPIVVGPDVFVIPQPSGRRVLGAGFVGEPVYSETKPQSENAEAERVLGLARRRIRGLEHVPLDAVTVGWRPLPIDGLPIVGVPESAPGLYLMVTHSGFSLAAILSQLATTEILDGVRTEMLTPYRVERFG